MQIAILSDIHDHVWNLRAALHFIRTADVDALICCGDLCSPFIVGILANGFSGPIHAVSGNNEGDWRQIMVNAANANASRAETRQIRVHGQFFAAEFGSRRIAVNHYPEIALPIAAAGQYDLVCFGHNHQLELRTIGTTLALNPGPVMGFNPLKTGEVKEVPATFAIFNCAASLAQAVDFFQISASWRSPDEPGAVVPFAPLG
jgi:hypothetical protein